MGSKGPRKWKMTIPMSSWSDLQPSYHVIMVWASGEGTGKEGMLSEMYSNFKCYWDLISNNNKIAQATAIKVFLRTRKQLCETSHLVLPAIWVRHAGTEHASHSHERHREFGQEDHKPRQRAALSTTCPRNTGFSGEFSAEEEDLGDSGGILSSQDWSCELTLLGQHVESVR